mgnify:CR=1 FL=1
MSRFDYRGGEAPILTAEQLVSRLTVPVSLLIIGKANVFFPTTNRSNPSVSVLVKYGGENVVKIHWTQWENVIVPVVNDDRLSHWRGLLVSGVPGDFETQTSKLRSGNLYSCDWTESVRQNPSSRHSQYLTQISGIIRQEAQSAGF